MFFSGQQSKDGQSDAETDPVVSSYLFPWIFRTNNTDLHDLTIFRRKRTILETLVGWRSLPIIDKFKETKRRQRGERVGRSCDGRSVSTIGEKKSRATLVRITDVILPRFIETADRLSRYSMRLMFFLILDLGMDYGDIALQVNHR